MLWHREIASETQQISAPNPYPKKIKHQNNTTRIPWEKTSRQTQNTLQLSFRRDPRCCKIQPPHQTPPPITPSAHLQGSDWSAVPFLQDNVREQILIGLLAHQDAGLPAGPAPPPCRRRPWRNSLRRRLHRLTGGGGRRLMLLRFVGVYCRRRGRGVGGHVRVRRGNLTVMLDDSLDGLVSRRRNRVVLRSSCFRFDWERAEGVLRRPPHYRCSLHISAGGVPYERLEY